MRGEMKGLLRALHQKIAAQSHDRPVTAPNMPTIRVLLCGIMTTRPDEIGCGEYYEQLDRFAEAAADGRDARGVIPLVEDHLARCDECREEFEALLTTMRASV